MWCPDSYNIHTKIHRVLKYSTFFNILIPVTRIHSDRCFDAWIVTVDALTVTIFIHLSFHRGYLGSPGPVQ